MSNHNSSQWATTIPANEQPQLQQWATTTSANEPPELLLPQLRQWVTTYPSMSHHSTTPSNDPSQLHQRVTTTTTNEPPQLHPMSLHNYNQWATTTPPMSHYNHSQWAFTTPSNEASQLHEWVITTAPPPPPASDPPHLYYIGHCIVYISLATFVPCKFSEHCHHQLFSAGDGRNWIKPSPRGSFTFYLSPFPPPDGCMVVWLYGWCLLVYFSTAPGGSFWLHGFKP